MKDNLTLLKTLLLSTSSVNIYKHSKDQKKRSRIIGNTIGVTILYLLLMAYCILLCIGYGLIGMTHIIPVICALTISVLSLVFTFFKSNGYLFNFKEYDMLMSLPFEAKTIAGCKFLYMYIQSLPWYLSISVAMMIGYGIYAHPFILVYPAWLILSLFLPIIPMLVSSFLGFLIAKISSGFRKTNMIQITLSFVLFLFSFSLRFILEDVFRNQKAQIVLEEISEITEKAGNIYMPAGWFAETVTSGKLSGALLLTGSSILLFTIVFQIVGNSYRNINSALKSHAASKNYKMTRQKQHSVVQAIAFKEFKRMTGSTTYLVNAAVGELLAVMLGVATLLIGVDKIVSIITQGAPINPSILHPAIPFIVYFLIGMMATTACSPSLEGKNYWIVQSLPIEKKTLYQGKMLFNMELTVPFMVFTTLCLCISAKVSLLQTLLYLLLGLALCAFSTAWGCVCGIRHMRLDWENEVEVIKQGSAVTIYMLPNMFVVMGLIVLVVFLGIRMNHSLLTLILIFIAAVLAAISYRIVMVLSKH